MRTNLKRFFLTAGSTAILLAAGGTPAYARATQCALRTATYSSLPLTSTLSDDLCSNGASAWAASSPVVTNDIPLWARPFVSVTSIHDGTFYDPSRYGGSETAWANVTVRITSPIGGLSVGTDTIYLRIWLTPEGVEHSGAGLEHSNAGL